MAPPLRFFCLLTSLKPQIEKVFNVNALKTPCTRPHLVRHFGRQFGSKNVHKGIYSQKTKMVRCIPHCARGLYSRFPFLRVCFIKGKQTFNIINTCPRNGYEKMKVLVGVKFHKSYHKIWVKYLNCVKSHCFTRLCTISSFG